MDTVTNPIAAGETCTLVFSETAESPRAAGEERNPFSLDIATYSTATGETGTEPTLVDAARVRARPPRRVER